MTTSSILRTTTFVVLLAAAPSFTLATSVVKLDDDSLVLLSSAIDEGDVTSVRSEWTPGHKQIVTTVEIRVSQAFKGSRPADGRLVLRLLGGRVGDTVMEAIGQPTFAEGEHVIVFLDAEGVDLMPITGLFQGKFTVLPDPATGVPTVVERGVPRDEFVRTVSRIVAKPEGGR